MKTIVEFTLGFFAVIAGLTVMALFNIVPWLIAIWIVIWAFRHFA